MKKLTIRFLTLNLIFTFLFPPISARANGLPDLTITKANCQLSWEDPATKDIYKFNDKVLIPPDRNDYQTNEEHAKAYDSNLYSLYTIENNTYATYSYGDKETNNANIDENQNGIIDQIEQKKVGYFLYNCYFTIKNIGTADFLDNKYPQDNIQLQLWTTEGDDYPYKGISVTNGEPNLIDIPLTSAGKESIVTLTRLLQFTPNGITYKPSPAKLWNYVPNKEIALKFWLNLTKPEKDYPSYLEKTFELWREATGNSDPGYSQKEESNFENNTFNYILTFPETNFPKQIEEITLTPDSANKKVTLIWDKITNAENYQVEGIVGTARNIFVNGKSTKFDTKNNSYIYDYSALTSQELVIFRVKSINKFGDTTSNDVWFYPPIDYFKDVEKDSWYEKSVYEAYYNEAIKGYTNSAGDPKYLYGPNDPVTITQVAAIITRPFTPNSGTDLVPDKYKSHWAAPILNYLIQNKFAIILNKEENPDRPATRAEVVRFIVEYKYFLNEETRNIFGTSSEVEKIIKYSFPDIANHPDKKDIQLAYDLSIINGNPDGTFKPDNVVNRAEIAQIYTNFREMRLREK